MKTDAQQQREKILKPSSWMKPVMLAAGAYNIIWGISVILFPNVWFETFDWTPKPIYPELWQCLGMIVGVYGVGYLISAFNPYRHWPIIFVGLLGKMFGPIGFLFAINKSMMPSSMGWTILTNDLIWWIPFTMILWGALRAHQSKDKIELNFLSPVNELKSQLGNTLGEISANQSVMVLFLRHSGCTFCREALSDLQKHREEIEKSGRKIALVQMGVDYPEAFLKKYDLDDVDCFQDPNCQLYEHFDLMIGKPSQLFGWPVWLNGAKAFFAGHGLGTLNGNGFRLAGSFLIRDGEVVDAYRNKDAADKADYSVFGKSTEACPMPANNASTHKDQMSL